MKKRMLAMLLTLAMVMSLFAGMSITASAEGGEQSSINLSDLEAGMVLPVGTVINIDVSGYVYVDDYRSYLWEMAGRDDASKTETQKYYAAICESNRISGYGAYYATGNSDTSVVLADSMKASITTTQAWLCYKIDTYADGKAYACFVSPDELGGANSALKFASDSYSVAKGSTVALSADFAAGTAPSGNYDVVYSLVGTYAEGTSVNAATGLLTAAAGETAATITVQAMVAAGNTYVTNVAVTVTGNGSGGDQGGEQSEYISPLHLNITLDGLEDFVNGADLGDIYPDADIEVIANEELYAASYSYVVKVSEEDKEEKVDSDYFDEWERNGGWAYTNYLNDGYDTVDENDIYGIEVYMYEYVKEKNFGTLGEKYGGTLTYSFGEGETQSEQVHTVITDDWGLGDQTLYCYIPLGKVADFVPEAGEGEGTTPPSGLTEIDAVSVAFDWTKVADPEEPADAVTLSPEHFQDKMAFWCYIDEEEGVMGLDYAEISGLPSDTMIYAQVGGLLESGYAFADVIATSCEEYEVVDYELDNYETDEYNVIFMLIEIGEASEVLALFGDNPPAENGPRAEIYIDPSTKDAFLGGDYIELGLRPNGAFGTEAAAPETFHPDGGWHERDGIGLRSNGSKKWSEGPPDDDDEATADFFLPGIIDEGWLVGWSTEKDGSASAKGGAQAYGGMTATAVPGDSVEATTKTGKDGEIIITAKTTAKVADTVDVVQTVEFDVTKKYFTTTVTLTNNGSDPVYDLSYIRAFDPDQRANDEFVDGDCTTDNYFYKDSDGNVWVMAFGNDNFNMGASYYPPYVPVTVSHDAMIEKAITPFVFCAAPSQDYTVQAVNTTFGWTLDYSSFYRDRNSGYLAGDALYGKHYFADGAIGLEFIIASLDAGTTVTFSWISSLDTDIDTTIDNIEQEVGNPGSDTPDPEIPSTPPTSSDIGSYTPPTVDVPMSNGENSVDVKVEVSGKDATIKPLNDKQIEQLVGDDNAAGDVVIDLTDMGKEIDTAGIPKKTLEAIVEAAEDVGNDTEHLVIKLTTAELKLDDAAMRAIVDQANGDVIKFNFDDVGSARLNDKQKEAIKDMDVRKGYEAYITVNGVRISDFRGGNVEIIVPYTVPAGERVAGFSVWYVDDNGKIEKQKSTYDGKNKWFVVTHFSDYVIVYDENDANVAGCTKDETCPINAYTDVDEQAWYHDGVHYCIEEGLMNGVGSNLFAPNGITTRGQIVTILWRLEGQPLVEVAEGFNDVFESDWYNNAIRWASANKIVNGYGDTFGPNDAITREQMAAILWRYCKYKGIDVSVGEETNILSYEDAFDISSWAMEAMQWACGSGLIQGIEKNNTMYLDPQGNAVRSQSATMIYRFCTEIKK